MNKKTESRLLAHELERLQLELQAFDDPEYAAQVAALDGEDIADIEAILTQTTDEAELLIRPLLILDLDETLWHGTESSAGVSFQLRPYLGEFLREVSQSYDLAVWTSASGDWMNAGLEVVRHQTGFDLAGTAFFLWDRSRCTLKRSEDGHYDWRKPARKLRAKWIRARYPRERILAVDDTAAKWACGYGHLVRVGEWTSDEQDTELRQLAAYLLQIADEPNLTKLEKRGWRKP